MSRASNVDMPEHFQNIYHQQCNKTNLLLGLLSTVGLQHPSLAGWWKRYNLFLVSDFQDKFLYIVVPECHSLPISENAVVDQVVCNLHEKYPENFQIPKAITDLILLTLKWTFLYLSKTGILKISGILFWILCQGQIVILYKKYSIFSIFAILPRYQYFLWMLELLCRSPYFY